MGNFQVLPNGNILLCIATAGVIKEFDPAGTLLWSKTTTGSTPKAFRYDSCYVFNAAPAIPVITLSNDTLFSTPATTYQWYYNGYQISGANDAFYVPTQNGNYLVRITDANGCVYMYSVDFAYTIPTGIATVAANDLVKIYPNPSTGLFTIKGTDANEKFDITVSDIAGKVMLKLNSTNSLDLNNYNNGVYLVTLQNNRLGSVCQKVTVSK